MTQRLRIEQVTAQWAGVRDRIATSLKKASRDWDELQVIAVTKTFPASDVEILQGLGFTEFGENRVDELQEKAAHDYELPLQWHMLGQLQTNKVNHAVRAANVIHSCDRSRLVQALARSTRNLGKKLDVLIQVRLDEDPRRGGIAPELVSELADEIAAAGSTNTLRLRGVMAMAPRVGDPERAFARLREVSEQLTQQHPGATWISAGMSQDYEIAIEYGATHIRLGRGLLGSRPKVG